MVGYILPRRREVCRGFFNHFFGANIKSWDFVMA